MLNNFFEECIAKHGFCFIAEISNNHLRDLERYCRLIEEAKAAGAHAVKIQTYSPQSLLAPGRVHDLVSEGPWKGQTFFSLYKNICAPLEWTQKLFDFARSLGIYMFSSPFSGADISALENSGCPAYKIASFEFSDVTLWDQLCALGKPILASTGIAGDDEIRLIAQNQAYRANLSVLFNCVISYPSSLAHLNSSRFDLFSSFGCIVGLSDHSLDAGTCIYAFAKGARVFEKHFTLSRKDGGPDASFSLEPNELEEHIKILKMCYLAESNTSMKSSKGQSFGRVVYATRGINAGEHFNSDNIGNFRPFCGCAVPSMSIKELFGRPANSSYSKGDFVNISELS